MAKRIRTYASLKAWRQAHGLSQRDAAEQLGLSPTMYSRFERQRGGRNLVARAKIISEKTCVPFEIVMGGA